MECIILSIFNSRYDYLFCVNSENEIIYGLVLLGLKKYKVDEYITSIFIHDDIHLDKISNCLKLRLYYITVNGLYYFEI